MMQLHEQTQPETNAANDASTKADAAEANAMQQQPMQPCADTAESMHIAAADDATTKQTQPEANAANDASTKADSAESNAAAAADATTKADAAKQTP
jgi:hypothetical protein